MNAQAQAEVGKQVFTQTEKKKGISSSKLGIVFVAVLMIGLAGGIFVISRALQENNDTSNNTIQPLNTKASDVTVTPPNQPLVQATPSPTPVVATVTETQPSPTDTLLALNTSPSPTIEPTEIPIPTELEPTDDDESTTAAQITQATTSTATTAPSSLPISGNTNFTLMAIAISGIIVLVSFVF